MLELGIIPVQKPICDANPSGCYGDLTDTLYLDGTPYTVSDLLSNSAMPAWQADRGSTRCQMPDQMNE